MSGIPEESTEYPEQRVETSKLIRSSLLTIEMRGSWHKGDNGSELFRPSPAKRLNVKRATIGGSNRSPPFRDRVS